MLGKESCETLIPVFHDSTLGNSHGLPETSKYNNRESVILNSDKEWEEFFELQNDLKTNRTNPKPFSRKINKYNGKILLGKIPNRIKAEILKGSDAIEEVKIKEAKRENDIVYPSVRVMLNRDKEVNVTKLLSNDVCKKYNVKTITLCHSDETRGACCYTNDNKERVYEIINGSYNMTIKWYVEEKECKIKINIDSNGTITLLESNDVTEEQLRANKKVKIGKKSKANFLHETSLLSNLQQSSETIKACHSDSSRDSTVKSSESQLQHELHTEQKEASEFALSRINYTSSDKCR